MDTYSQMTTVDPESDPIHIPEGWTAVLYNDDSDKHPICLESSLPKKGDVVMVYVDDRIEDYITRHFRKQRDEKQGLKYIPQRVFLVQYEGQDHDGCGIWFKLTEYSYSPDYGGTRHTKPMSDLAIAWKAIELPRNPFET